LREREAECDKKIFNEAIRVLEKFSKVKKKKIDYGIFQIDFYVRQRFNFIESQRQQLQRRNCRSGNYKRLKIFDEAIQKFDKNLYLYKT